MCLYLLGVRRWLVLKQKLLEEARKEGQQTKDEVEAVREQLKQTRKAHRACESQVNMGCG